MKKLMNSLLLILMLASMSACGNDYDVFQDGNHRGKSETGRPMIKTVRMSFGGDFITESEEPLQRARDGETYVAINVYRKEKNKDDAKNEKYAYGLFKGKDDISIDLLTGYNYSFYATIIVDYIDKVEVLSNGVLQDPFKLNENVAVKYTDFLDRGEKVFVYHSSSVSADNRPYFAQLNSGTAYVNNNGDLLDGGKPKNVDLMRYPRVKRFYGKLIDFDASNISEKNPDVVIPMDYKSFGLKFLIDKIPEGTNVEVKDITTYTGSDPGDYRYLLFPLGLTLGTNEGDDESWDGIFSLNDLTKDSQKFTLRFTWNKLSGNPETFTHTFEVTAKKQKVLKLHIEGDAGEVTTNNKGNIVFTMNDSWEEIEEDQINKKY